MFRSENSTKYVVFFYSPNHFILIHVDDDGKCVKARLNNYGKLEWVKYSCDDVSGGGVICARRSIWEEIPDCYAQPEEEAAIGSYIDVSTSDASQDPIKFCRDICQDGSRYFDVKTTVTSTVCHCLKNPTPLGGFLDEEDCNVPICSSDVATENNNTCRKT